LNEKEKKEDVLKKTRSRKRPRQQAQIKQFQEWTETVTQHMPHLSQPLVTVLAFWSFGMVVANSCGVTTVSVSLAALFGYKENTMRQRLREWYKDASSKKGDKRTE
jgi:TRAP-type C4-dicarboxylate transport system permease large subunit